MLIGSGRSWSRHETAELGKWKSHFAAHSWSAFLIIELSVLFLIDVSRHRTTDCPPHGTRFHNLMSSNDFYPDGHPNDPSPDVLIRSIGERGIHYTIGRVLRENHENVLDKMIQGKLSIFFF